MKKILTGAAVYFLAALMLVGGLPARALADEGMFLPDAIATLPLEKLKKRGMKVKPTDLYNPNGASIKDAIVLVGGGTGEFVSAEGLLLTNHHVAFDALVSASDEKNNYGETGYTARTRADELPAQGYTVSVTQELKDVTAEILNGLSDATPNDERAKTIAERIAAMEKDGSKPADGVRVRVTPMNEGLAYYKFTYFVLRDVRVAYAPPKNIGFYGGDDDNFEWPRHCGDFTFMRAYVGKDGKPADYAKDNKPYKPAKYLSISMGGVKENDFTMIMGYPGATTRYRESYSVAYNQDQRLPFLVDMLTNWIEALQDAGKYDAALRVKLQSDIFGLANTQKAFSGGVIAMRRANIVPQKRAAEAAFTEWVKADPARQAKYGDIFGKFAEAYAELNQSGIRDAIIQQMGNASPVLGLAIAARRVSEQRQSNPQAADGQAQRARGQAGAALAERTPFVEVERVKWLLRRAAELPAGQRIEPLEARFANPDAAARLRAEDEAARAFAGSKNFASAEAFDRLLTMTPAQLNELNDPALDMAAKLVNELDNAASRTQRFNGAVLPLRRRFLAGMTEMKGKLYPDANRTLRFTYGDVKGYVPREGMNYLAFTTLAGVVEKDTGREPFNAPEGLKQAYAKRDFGPYNVNNNVPVNFLTTNDIIGGNSGSPVLNGKGEQVGIAFDGNYEGLGNDFFINEPTNRTIVVDIRYVLFVTDRFGGAGYLLKELDLKNKPKGL
jgi:hypothetical protein